MEFSKAFREPFRKRIDSLELKHQRRGKEKEGVT